MGRMNEQQMLARFDYAVSNHHFFLCYQPKINHTTGQMVGAEALLRWEDPEYGMQYPNDFIPVFEKNNLITKADLYVVEEICRFQKKCLGEKLGIVPVSFNMSRYDLAEDGYIDTVEQIRRKYDVPVQYLRTEITETASIGGKELVMSAYDRLHSYGYAVEMDDFGSGYSSLNVLKDLEVDVIKLDMRFFEESNSDRAGTIISSVVRMARWLHTPVIAEGVETVEMADFMSSLGCIYIQGYLYSKPVREDEFIKKLSIATHEPINKSNKLLSIEESKILWGPDSISTTFFENFAGAAAMFTYYDGQVEISRVNRKYLKEIGGDVTENDMTDTDPWTRHELDSRREYTAAIERAIRSEDEEVCETWRTVKNANGEEDRICVRSTIRLIASDGDQYLFYAMIKNVTAEKKRISLVEYSAREFRNIVNTISKDYLNVFYVDLEEDSGRVIKLDGFSPSGIYYDETKLFSYTKGIARYINERVYSEDVDIMREALRIPTVKWELEHKNTYAFTYRVLEDGEIHYRQFRFFKLDDNDKIVLIFQDVDHTMLNHKKTEKLLEEALDTAKRANEAKTNYLSHVSHDIRTPLNGIIGLLDMNEKHADDVALIEDNNKKIKVAADHLLSLINDVLELSKIEDGSVILAKEPFGLSEIENEVITIAGMKANDMNIKIINKAEAFMKEKLIGSPLHLKQILLNIMGNSIKYNREGGTVTYSSSVLSKSDNSVLFRCRITDTGIGMSPEFVEHIFEPFSQEHTDERSVFQGTGLGMSIVKQLVDKMNGTVVVESLEGVGSKFTIEIPFEVSSETTDLIVEENTEPDISGLKILVAEDNKINMFIAKKYLSDAGAKIIPAYNGVDVLKIFEKYEPGTFDVILMDIMMPIMGGLKATKEIRKLDRPDAKTIPIIAMTANVFEEDKQEALDAGMNGYTIKPLDFKILAREIVKFTNKK